MSEDLDRRPAPILVPGLVEAEKLLERLLSSEQTAADRFGALDGDFAVAGAFERALAVVRNARAAAELPAELQGPGDRATLMFLATVVWAFPEPPLRIPDQISADDSEGSRELEPGEFLTDDDSRICTWCANAFEPVLVAFSTDGMERELEEVRDSVIPGYTLTHKQAEHDAGLCRECWRLAVHVSHEPEVAVRALARVEQMRALRQAAYSRAPGGPATPEQIAGFNAEIRRALRSVVGELEGMQEGVQAAAQQHALACRHPMLQLRRGGGEPGVYCVDCRGLVGEVRVEDGGLRVLWSEPGAGAEP